MKKLKRFFLIGGSLVFGALALISALTLGNSSIQALSEKYAFESIYVNTNIDFVIPSPSDAQVLEMESNESIGVNSVTPYYFTESGVSINQKKTVTSNILIFGYPDKMENTPYCAKRIIGGRTAFDGGDAIVDSSYADKNSCKTGDSITISLLGTTYRFAVAAIAEANPDYQNGSIALILPETDNRYLIENGIRYSGAYVSAGKYDRLKEYLLKDYKPLGRLKAVSAFATEEAYNLHVTNFNAADWSREITIYRDNYTALSVKYLDVDASVRQYIFVVCAVASVTLIAFAVVSLILPGIKDAVAIYLRKNQKIATVKRLYIGGMLYDAFVFALVYCLTLFLSADVERSIVHPYFVNVLLLPLITVAVTSILTILITSIVVGILYRPNLNMMLKLYFKDYRYRIAALGATMLSIVISIIIVFASFNKVLRFCADELAVYRKSTFRYGYILNYPIGLQDEYLFPDVDIPLYTNADKLDRIVASEFMEIPTNEYTSDSLIRRVSNDPLGEGEIQLSKNVADRHDLAIGSVLYGEYPYSTEFVRLTVAAIGDAKYDIVSPRAANNMGVVLLGYSHRYQESVSCKYLVFSDEKLTDELARFPQIVDSTISRDGLVESVVLQAVPFLIWIIVALVMNLVLQWVFIYKQSIRSLSIMQRKGMQHNQLKEILIGEFLAFIVLPTFLTAIVENALFMRLPWLFFVFVAIALVMLMVFPAAVILWLYRRFRR